MRNCKKCNIFIPRYCVWKNKKLDCKSRCYCINCRPPKHIEISPITKCSIIETMICQKCGGTFPRRQIIDNKTRSYHHRKYCTSCSPLQIHAAKSQKNKITKSQLVNLKGGCCQICGYNKCNRNLHFHHVDQNTKEFSVGRYFSRRLQKVIEELNKCVLLCANCHGEVHDKLVTCPTIKKVSIPISEDGDLIFQRLDT